VPDDPRSMTAYLASIKAANRATILDGTAFATTYQYSAAIDAGGNYVLTKTGGAASNPNTILVPASYKAGPNPADPIVTIAESLYMSNPWYGVDGGPVGPTQNNLAGAVARDLYAALNLGYVNSEHVVAAGDTVNAALVGQHVYELTGSQMRELTVGFGEVNEFYNIYAAAIRDLSDSYGYAYTDWNEHLSKVAVLINQPRSGITADELHVEITGSLTPGFLDGDYNADGAVDAADYTVWRDGLGSIYTPADYEVWKAHFGQSAGSGSLAFSASHAAVPEPTSLWLMCVAWAAAISCRHRHDL